MRIYIFSRSSAKLNNNNEQKICFLPGPPLLDDDRREYLTCCSTRLQKKTKYFPGTTSKLKISFLERSELFQNLFRNISNSKFTPTSPNSPHRWLILIKYKFKCLLTTMQPLSPPGVNTVLKRCICLEINHNFFTTFYWTAAGKTTFNTFLTCCAMACNFDCIMF